MANIFISHRSSDSDAAEALASDIEASGHTVWLDAWAIDVGDSIVSSVQDALGKAQFVVLCCSAAGMSNWVDREWMSALARQLAGHDVKLLPTLLPGGKIPAILCDVRYADLAADWDAGVRALVRAIQR